MYAIRGLAAVLKPKKVHYPEVRSDFQIKLGYCNNRTKYWENALAEVLL